MVGALAELGVVVVGEWRVRRGLGTLIVSGRHR